MILRMVRSIASGACNLVEIISPCRFFRSPQTKKLQKHKPVRQSIVWKLQRSSEWICFPDAPPDLAEPSVAAPWLLPVVLRGYPAATSVTYDYYSAVTRLPPI